MGGSGGVLVVQRRPAAVIFVQGTAIFFRILMSENHTHTHHIKGREWRASHKRSTPPDPPMQVPFRVNRFFGSAARSKNEFTPLQSA